MADTSAKDPFMFHAKGRYPVSTHSSAAPNWRHNPDGTLSDIPKPDCSYSTLSWLTLLGGILGLDHFYLRSPGTGIVKLLTFGGFFIWWLWDVCQVWGEKDRILAYGLTTPFDMTQGIAQGMITDRSTHYKAASSYSLWVLTALFSFLGTDALMAGKPALLFRKLFDFKIFAACAVWAAYASNWVSMVFAILFLIPFAFFVLTPYSKIVGSAFSTESLFNEGIRIEKKDYNALNPFTQWTKGLDPAVQAKIAEDFGIGSISRDLLRKRYATKWTDGQEEEEEVESTKDDGNWVASLFLMGPLFPGWLMGTLASSFAPLKLFIESQYGVVSASSLLGSAVSFVPGGALAADLAKGALGGDLAKIATGDLTKMATGALGGDIGKLAETAKATATGALGGKMATGDLTKMATGALGSLAPPGLQERLAMLQKIAKPQTGGSREEGLSIESKILGATITAIAAGGALKGLIDWLMDD